MPERPYGRRSIVVVAIRKGIVGAIKPFRSPISPIAAYAL